MAEPQFWFRIWTSSVSSFTYIFIYCCIFHKPLYGLLQHCGLRKWQISAQAWLPYLKHVFYLAAQLVSYDQIHLCQNVASSTLERGLHISTVIYGTNILGGKKTGKNSSKHLPDPRESCSILQLEWLSSRHICMHIFMTCVLWTLKTVCCHIYNISSLFLVELRHRINKVFATSQPMKSFLHYEVQI